MKKPSIKPLLGFINKQFRALLIISLLIIAASIFKLADAVDSISLDVNTYGIESELSDIARQIYRK